MWWRIKLWTVKVCMIRRFSVGVVHIEWCFRFRISALVLYCREEHCCAARIDIDIWNNSVAAWYNEGDIIRELNRLCFRGAWGLLILTQEHLCFMLHIHMSWSLLLWCCHAGFKIPSGIKPCTSCEGWLSECLTGDCCIWHLRVKDSYIQFRYPIASYQRTCAWEILAVCSMEAICDVRLENRVSVPARLIFGVDASTRAQKTLEILHTNFLPQHVYTLCAHARYLPIT